MGRNPNNNAAPRRKRNDESGSHNPFILGSAAATRRERARHAKAPDAKSRQRPSLVRFAVAQGKSDLNSACEVVSLQAAPSDGSGFAVAFVDVVTSPMT